mmetsp:Transcript_3805/g.3121  ORF Transcript_3805/g.3121 Transcript_3805/m.3121 type:complete len:103 (-) Transcript_3805:130-438(-)
MSALFPRAGHVLNRRFNKGSILLILSRCSRHILSFCMGLSGFYDLRNDWRHGRTTRNGRIGLMTRSPVGKEETPGGVAMTVGIGPGTRTIIESGRRMRMANG